jgi:HD-GYP domain-containing protein (c-di-GMP phosphodiesterase class II)
VAHTGTDATDQVRTTELIGALCLATDLGMGLPFEHGLQTALIATRLAQRLGVDEDTAVEVYHASLLAHAGCTAEAHVAAEIFGGSMTEHFNPVRFGTSREQLVGLVRSLPDPDVSRMERTAQIARRLPRMAKGAPTAISANCEVAATLAGQVGAPEAVPGLLAYLPDRWDGAGPLRRARGEQIPLPMRIVHVAVDAAFQRLVGGTDHARDRVAERSGHAFDPAVATCLVDNSADILAPVAEAWDAVLDAEPGRWRWLDHSDLDRGLAAMGRFADLVSPDLTGHSAAVTDLSCRAAELLGLPAPAVTALRRAGSVHDLGRVAVHARIWNKPGPLDADEAEQVRLHTYYTDRVLSRSGSLATLATIAGAHHERVDGSGYHRGALAAQLPVPARLLAAVVAYQSKLEPRRYRPALTPESAAAHVVAHARAGHLDPDAVEAVVAAAGQPRPDLPRVAGLTTREAQVLALLARGRLTRQIARALGISTKTADRHIQNTYRKIGVSSRAAATLFAAEQGLTVWGDLPIGQPPAES